MTGRNMPALSAIFVSLARSSSVREVSLSSIMPEHFGHDLGLDICSLRTMVIVVLLINLRVVKRGLQ